MAGAIGGLWAGFDLVQIYDAYTWLIDPALYVLLFTSVAHTALGRKFKGRPVAGISIAVGVALAVGATHSAHRAGFTIGSLGPVAWLVALTLAAVLVFQFSRDLGAPALRAAAFSGFFIFLAAGLLGEPLLSSLYATGLWGLFQLVGSASTVFLLWVVFSSLGKHVQGPRRQAWAASNAGEAEHLARWKAAGHRAFTSGRSPLVILENLQAALERGPVDGEIHALVDELQRTERRLVSVYKQALGQLARSRIRNSEGGLSSGQREVLVAAQRNIAEYDRAIMVLVEATAVQNKRLCVEAVNRAHRFEVEGLRLAKLLLSVLRENPKRI